MPSPKVPLPTLTLDGSVTTERRVAPGSLRVITYESARIARKHSTKGKINSGLFPPVVRWISDDLTSCIIERPPMMMDIDMRFAPKYDSGAKRTKYTVPLPWLLYYVQIEVAPSGRRLTDQGIYARNSSLMSMDDDIYVFPLPNLFSTGQMCLPETTGTYLNEFNDLASIANYVLNTFWDAGNNMNAPEVYTSKSPDYICEKAGISDKRTLNQPDPLRKYFEAWSKMSIQELLEVQFEGRQTVAGMLAGKRKLQVAGRTSRSSIDRLTDFIVADVKAHKQKDLPYENKTTGRPPF